MKNTIQTSLIVIVIITLSSFTQVAELDYAGTYGVSENDNSKIELTLNKDKTFTYKDLSNSAKPIDVKGNWEVKNNKIILKDYESECSFHSKWKISKDGKLAESRKGLTFYSLIKK